MISAVGITCDFWSDKRLQSYMVLTGHYISPANQFVSKILSFDWFHHRHSTINIYSAIMKQLNNLKIEGKTRWITTDGASNMVALGDMMSEQTRQIVCQ